MPAVTVKNIPQNIYRQLKKAAANNRRSINSEIIFRIECSLQSQRLDPNLLIIKARQLRERTASFPISDDEFNNAKAAGRP